MWAVRKNALDHIDAAYQNGFSPFSTGCHVIIADGLKGTDEELVPVEGGEYVKEAKIGRAIMDADVLSLLSHFKGHEATGFGGALKEYRHGLRIPRRQDGNAQRRQSPMWSRKTASAAAAVSKSAPMMLPPLQTARPLH